MKIVERGGGSRKRRGRVRVGSSALPENRVSKVFLYRGVLTLPLPYPGEMTEEGR